MAAHPEFTFADPEKDLAAFLTEAGQWKPSEYDDAMRTRFEYYSDRHQRDTVERMKLIFPKTWQAQVPYYVPLTRFIVDERARAYAENTRFALTRGGEPLEKDDPLVAWWEQVLERSSLLWKLRTVDRYLELFRTVFLLPYRDARTKARGFRIYAPQNAKVVFSADDPIDLDLAYGVAFEIANQGGVRAADEKGRRWVFWCGRPTNRRMLVVNGDGTVERIGGSNENPFADEQGPLVPAVMWLGDTEEVGAFSLSGQLLVDVNRALNLAKTDEHGIARAQGYGQMYAEVPDGVTPPTTMLRGPEQVLVVQNGIKLGTLSGSPQLQALDAMLQDDIKLHAMLERIAPGSVSLNGRGVASGIALQIERQPLNEQRRDRIELHRAPLRRLWRVFRAVHNAYAKEDGLPAIADDVEMSVHWGELEQVEDPKTAQDVELIDLANDLTTRERILAARYRISEDDARALLEANRAANAASGAGRAAVATLLAGGAGRSGSMLVRAEGAGQAGGAPGGSPLDAARAQLQTPRQQLAAAGK